ncbi:unnamed protein product [Ectocarpus sp. 4 AP-2014]
MNKLLLRGGLVRATTRSSGSSFVQSAVRRHSSAEEVAREHADHDDDVVERRHAANTTTTSGSSDASPRQVDGFREYRGNDVAPPAWSSLAAANPQRRSAADGTSRTEVRPSSWGLSRDPERAGPAAAVSAPAMARGALNGSRPPASSRVTESVAPWASGNGGQAVVTRNAAPQQNNNSNSREPARNPWDIKLSLEPKSYGDEGGSSIARLGHPSGVEAKRNGVGGGLRSGHMRPFLNGASSSNSDDKVSPPNASVPASRMAMSLNEDGEARRRPPIHGRSEQRRLAAAQEKRAAKVAAQASSLPWNLPVAREESSSGMKEQREALDKMMGGERYGGSHAAHRGSQGASRKKNDVKVVPKEVQIPAVAVTVRELAMAMSKKAREVVFMLRQMGESNVSPSFMVEPDIAQMVAKEFGLRTKLLKLRDSDLGRTRVTEETFDSLEPRPPVVSVMGHVDHGKTTLLDALRTSKAKVAGTEAAGITQKIGAFSVEVKDSSVTFFDTPGHAAFKSMRHATSRLTDIVVVVIAADDGVKSQTVEVFDLLKEFPNLAPVVAVTKIDQYDVDTEKAVDRISRQLLEHSIITEGYGGEVPIVPVSAVTREGFDDLLETLLLQAEVLELRADNKAAAEGLVVDSAIVKGQGGVADVLVTWGKLKPKDVVVAGTEYGKVRGLIGSGGKRMKEAGAAEPVRIVGMKGLPKMGDEVVVVASESEARAVVAQRIKQQEVKELEKQAEKLGSKRLSEQATKRLKDMAAAAIRRREKALYDAREAARVMKSRRDESSKVAAKAAEEFAARAMNYAEEAIRRSEAQDEDQDDGPTKCFAIFKAEGFGMLEAMSQVMTEVPQDEVELSLLKTGLGSVTQSDVEAAALAEASIFAFNVGGVPADVKAKAQKEGVQIHSHDVIYRFLDDVKAVMSSLLPPAFEETVIGEAKTLQVFETTGKNKETVSVAGLEVSSGKLSRTHFFRVIRDEEVVADRVKAASMRRHKDRVNEVTKDKECGVALEDFDAFKEGDVVQCYSLEEIKRTL